MKKTDKYTVSMLVNGLTKKGSGNDLGEALASLNLGYRDIKTKGEITVTCGDRSASRLIQLPKLRRYFASKLFMTALIREFERLLR